MLNNAQLEKLLLYENEDVISRFLDLFLIKEDECRELFRETRKFLYISQIKGVFIPDDLLILDEMWHNFILFTPVYHAFCKEFFGAYFHHIPASREEKERKKWLNQHEPEKASAEFLEAYEKLLEITHDYLGEETVIRWFQVYPEKYSKHKLKLLRR